MISSLQMRMSVNFLLQATRVLHVCNYDREELEMIYNFMVSVDNEILNHYNITSSVIVYSSDLELYIEIVDALIDIFEGSEEYEKCDELKNKKEEALILIKK